MPDLVPDSFSTVSWSTSSLPCPLTACSVTPYCSSTRGASHLSTKTLIDGSPRHMRHTTVEPRARETTESQGSFASSVAVTGCVCFVHAAAITPQIRATIAQRRPRARGSRIAKSLRAVERAKRTEYETSVASGLTTLRNCNGGGRSGRPESARLAGNRLRSRGNLLVIAVQRIPICSRGARRRSALPSRASRPSFPMQFYDAGFRTNNAPKTAPAAPAPRWDTRQDRRAGRPACARRRLEVRSRSHSRCGC